MIGTTAAILGAAAIGAAGSVASGAMQSSAAKKASDAQVQAAEISAGVQRDSITQSRLDAYPWAYAGATALYAYMDELGLPRPVNPIMPSLTTGPFAVDPATGQAISNTSSTGTTSSTTTDANGRPITQTDATSGTASGTTTGTTTDTTGTTPSTEMTQKLGFQQTPGYQFQLSEGTKAVTNNLSALGMKNSGLAMKSLDRYSQGVANQEYNNYLNRLASMAGMGQTQTNTTNALTQNAASNIGSTYENAGAARASGYIGSANAWSNAIGGVTNNFANALGYLAYKS